MPVYTSEQLFDMTKSIAAPLLQRSKYPWEALAGISDFILEVGPTLPVDLFDHPAEDVWISKDAKVAPTASVSGPCIIDRAAEVRHGAFIRGSAIVGKEAVVGNSTELKNSILFDCVQVPHFNYVGDSVLGHKAHLGAGALTSNVKSDRSLVVVKGVYDVVETGRKKVGTMLGDCVEVGCNSVLCPGSVLGRNCIVYPTSCVRGVIQENSIFKSENDIVKKK